MSTPKSHAMQIVLRTSDDVGKTWSEPITLFQHPDMLGADPNLVLDRDRVLAFSTTVPKPGVIERTLIYMRENKDGFHWSDEVQIAMPHRYIAERFIADGGYPTALL
ncbi:exo-alpha-sialidase [Edaphobacter sp. HDX4]|uniref:sialidase family protein n=1 Tax=Edaphobacter sp. HDX4 TaxID=2794064 RepID=UPI002FE542C9